MNRLILFGSSVDISVEVFESFQRDNTKYVKIYNLCILYASNKSIQRMFCLVKIPFIAYSLSC